MPRTEKQRRKEFLCLSIDMLEDALPTPSRRSRFNLGYTSRWGGALGLMGNSEDRLVEYLFHLASRVEERKPANA